mmetsp:Transcript_12213/g.36642  ORF Transcript_12213/g.36642 Transcript_12213/m.36642 type:complete len:406 (+) Transcript_12213:200-1417(+)
MAPVVLPLLVLASLALAVAPSAVTGGADGMSAQAWVGPPSGDVDVVQRAGSQRRLAAVGATPKRAVCNSQSMRGPNGCVCKPGRTIGSDRKCRGCPPGTFKKFAGNGKCTACRKGTYSSKSASGSCKSCPNGFVNEQQTKCQPGCLFHSDGTTVQGGRFWAKNTWVFYYGNSRAGPSAAEVCDSMRNLPDIGDARNLIPADITTLAQQKTAVRLAKYAFACEAKPEVRFNSGEPFEPTAWSLRGYRTAVASPGTCQRLKYTSYYGTVISARRSPCIGPLGVRLPVLCSQGCRRFCVKCSPKLTCLQCVPGYKPNWGGNCVPEDIRGLLTEPPPPPPQPPVLPTGPAPPAPPTASPPTTPPAGGSTGEPTGGPTGMPTVAPAAQTATPATAAPSAPVSGSPTSAPA